MEFKGTKGKCELSKPFDGTILIKGNVKAVVLPYSEIKGLQEEDKANAVLFSKAPEMLRMLIEISKTAKKIWEIEQDNPFFDEIDFAELDDLIQSATELK